MRHEPPTAREFLDLLSARMEAIIAADDEPGQLMDRILVEVEQAGILDASGAIRCSSAWVFVMDVLTDNPRAYDWAQIARERNDPRQIRDTETLLETISR